LAEETRLPGENHQSVSSHWKTLEHKAVLTSLRLKWEWSSQIFVVISTDYVDRCLEISIKLLPWKHLNFLTDEGW